jgi:hypothetical protein
MKNLKWYSKNMAEWWNGRHRRLKISCSDERAGSTPASATTLNTSPYSRPKVGDLVVYTRPHSPRKVGIVIEIDGVKMLVKRGSEHYWYNRFIHWEVVK